MAEDNYKKNKVGHPLLLKVANLQKKLNFFMLYVKDLEKKIDLLEQEIGELKKTLDHD